MKHCFYIVILCLAFLGCNPENNTEEVLPVAVYTVDFSTVIEENPSNNKLLGFIYATTNIGTVTYAIDSQSLEGAFSVEPDTGKFRVADPSLFDFESRTLITAVIAVTNGDVTEYANASVEITDVFLENEQRLAGLDKIGAFSGPLFCDTRNSFEFENTTLVRWFTDYSNTSFNDEIVTNGNKITAYTLNFQSTGSTYNEFYTFQYNMFGLVSSIQYTREDPAIPSTETSNYSISYNQLDGLLVNDATGETIAISFDIERFIRRVESASRSLEYDYDLNNNLISKTDNEGNTVTYLYDNKRNPFLDIASYNFGEIRGLINVLRFNESTDLLSSSRHNGIWQSTNNILAIDAMNCSGNCIESVSYSYEYNSDGYPSRKTREGGNGSAIVYNYQ